MVQDLRLYINDKLVDLSTDPQVLYTYQQTDVTNPTAVKNSFSKTITLVGTPNNNDIFGHYWNLERFILNSGEGGAYFNSSKKAPFQLYRGNDLYEEGYAKLNAINKVGDIYKYEISLFGGLGDFFWNLSSSDSGDEKKLSDLTYIDGESEFDFTMNIDAVNTAWRVLGGQLNPNFEQYKKWRHINFMPAYNGIPNDFDADKVIINASGTTLTKGAKNSDDDKWYYMKNNFTVGTLPAEMTEWESRDLRSYLQRPCIKMSSIINACCNPDNNGGYTVDLDPDFFNDNNPYWSKTWLSLPMIQDLENHNEQQVLEGVDLVTATTSGDAQGLMYQDLRFELGDINPNVSNVTLKTKITPYLRYPFCPYTSYVWFWNWNGDSYHTGNWCLGSLFVQLIAVNGETVVGASEVYNLTTPVRHNGGLWYGHNGHYPDSTGIDPDTHRKKMGNGSKYIPYMDANIYNVLGKFTSNGFVKEISHNSSSSTYDTTPAEFTFHIYNIGTNITGLKMVYYWGATSDKVKKTGASNKLWDRTYDNGWMFRDSIYDYRPIEVTEHNLTITSHNMYAVMGESLGRTGTKVTKQLLLNTESSPCDYLLSYCKMFGLHFTKDVGSKTIHIMTRKTFFQRDNIVDLNDLIDRSKDINITPIMFKSKWYQFLQEKDETEYQQKYITAKGIEYGCKVLDTGYEFSAEKIDLLKDNCIKSGIEGLEKSKWFTAYNNDASLRPWMNLGLKYTLWNGADTMEYNAGVGNSGTLLPINEGEGLKYYDIIPKLQFHDGKNSPTDGNNCLVFFSGFKNVNSGRANPLTYILSDDSVWQTDMNEGTPCWLFTKEEVVDGKRLCYTLSKIPVFERYLTGKDSGSIIKSLDFGSAQELYVPNYSLTDDTNIYYNFWGSYLNDLFNVNTKQMSCFIRIKDKPGIDWLRRFYWFDNSIWVANKISDYNIASYNTTKVEFIKVQDINSYSSITQGKEKIIELSANTYSVGKSGGNVVLTVTADPGIRWKLMGSSAGTPATLISVGTGTQHITVPFGQNTHDYSVGVYFYATREDNGYTAKIYVEQGYEDEQYFRAEPEDLVIPSTGGTYEVDFIWYNQGSAYVDYVDFNEGSDYLQFAVDTTTKKHENKAILYFNANTGDTVLHNYCTFYSYDCDANFSIGIDQLPYGYNFGNGNEDVNMTVYYSSGATFSDIPYWLDVIDNGDSTYTFKSRANDGEDRSGVVLMTKGTTAPLRVYQSGITEFAISRLDGTGNVAATGATATLQILSSENPWTVTSDSYWCVPAFSTSTESTALTVNISANEDDVRQATLTFINGVGATKTFTFMQEGAEMSGSFVTPQSKEMVSAGGTYGLTINTRHSWTIPSYPAWLSLSQTGGTGSASIVVTVDANNNDNMRTGTISIYDTNADRTYTSSIIQLGTATTASLVCEPNPLNASSNGGTYPITLAYQYRGDDVPAVTVSDDHIAISDVSWNGDIGSARVLVKENTSATQYTGTITFSGQQSTTLVINQAGATPYLSMSPASVSFGPTGGTATIIITTNTDWTIV